MSIYQRDKQIVNNALARTNPEKLFELFGHMNEYKVSKNVNIEEIANKAVYRLTDDEFFYLKARETVGFEDLKRFYTNITAQRLHYDFNKTFGINPHKKMSETQLKQFEKTSFDQTLHIPMSQEVVDKIKSAEKFPLPTSSNRHGNAIKLKRHVKYYACEVDGQVVPIALVYRNHPKKQTLAPDALSTISVFVLIRGKVPFFISRFDLKPKNKHANKLTDDHKTTREKISTKKTHMHLYNLKYSILFPTARAAMHADTLDLSHITTFDQAENYMLETFNFQQHENQKLSSRFEYQQLEQSTQPQPQPEESKNNLKAERFAHLNHLDFNF